MANGNASMKSAVKIQFRLPRKMHAALVRLAKQNRRSMNAEVLIAIDERVKKGGK